MNNEISYILVLDDEVPAMEYLKETLEEVISEVPDLVSYNVIPSSTYGDFIKNLIKYKPKIIFLDIQMPNKTGLEIAEEIRKNPQNYGYENNVSPLIIFSTAYENYGYKAFQVDAEDYILKPIDHDKIKNVLLKVIKNNPDMIKESQQTLKVPSSGVEIELSISDIIYFKADMKYIAVYTDKKEFLLNETLVNLENKFEKFIKIHRAYLINPGYIQKFYKKENQWYVSLRGLNNKPLPVSRRQRSEIEKKLNYRDIFL